MISFALSFVFGAWLLQQQSALPDFNWAFWMLVALPVLLIPQSALWQRLIRSGVMLAAALASGFFYAGWIAQQRLTDTLPNDWQGRDITLIGVVAELPRQHERGLSFVFDVEQVTTENAHVPQHIFLSTYRDEKTLPLVLHAGERWQLSVRLKQPHGTSNPYNFDFEAWALERNIRAVGYVYGKGTNLRLEEFYLRPAYFIEKIRESVRARFQKTLGDAPYTGVLSALAIGDQGSISASQWQIFTRTGVNHLMSISGLHITMLAGFAFALTYGLWRRNVRLALYVPARKVAVVVGFLVALLYALLAGYGVPAQRTVYMLATIAIALWSSRNIVPSQLLASALIVVTLLDPWAVLAPGFWLSFSAVALIFYITANRLGIGHWLVEYAHVQWAMSIGLIPLLLAMFQQISLVSPVANAFAIPLVEFVTVPLTLLGALLPFDWPLQLAHQSMSLCMSVLLWLNDTPAAVWTQHAPPTWTITIGMLGVFWMLLPKGFPARGLGALMLLPMFTLPPSPPVFGTLRLYVFDVGQGLAIAAQTQHHALLYDTGPDFNGEADSGNRILVPAMRGLGITQLDGLILTHDDIDHTGGAASVMQAIPINWISSSLAQDHPLLRNSPIHHLCVEGQSWEWDGVKFEILHPTNASYARKKIRDNDRGCVLRIRSGEQTALLTTDIEKISEQQLIENHRAQLDANLLIVPHHGSKTSSSAAFIQAVHPHYSVFTVGYRNRFHHPNAEVFNRYTDTERLRSDEDGALIFEMNANLLTIERYRKTHARYWHTP